MPKIAHIAALWSQDGHPRSSRPWSLDRRIAAAAAAGFTGIATDLTPEHRRLAEKHGIEHLVGYIATHDPVEFAQKVLRQKEGGAVHINVQLGRHDTPPSVATKQWMQLERAAEKIGGVVVSLETHRDRCTETPEKTYEIAERYHKATGRNIRFTFDFSHLAVVKHLEPQDYAKRLLDHPELVACCDQCHFRPFNGHHCQVAVTVRGKLTPEAADYLPFAKAVMSIWKKAPANRDRTLFACPETGPYGHGNGGGYNITGLPPAWPQAVELRSRLAALWARA